MNMFDGIQLDRASWSWRNLIGQGSPLPAVARIDQTTPGETNAVAIDQTIPDETNKVSLGTDFQILMETMTQILVELRVLNLNLHTAMNLGPSDEPDRLRSELAASIKE